MLLAFTLFSYFQWTRPYVHQSLVRVVGIFSITKNRILCVTKIRQFHSTIEYICTQFDLIISTDDILWSYQAKYCTRNSCERLWDVYCVYFGENVEWIIENPLHNNIYVYAISETGMLISLTLWLPWDSSMLLPWYNATTRLMWYIVWNTRARIRLLCNPKYGYTVSTGIIFALNISIDALPYISGPVYISLKRLHIFINPNQYLNNWNALNVSVNNIQRILE